MNPIKLIINKLNQLRRKAFAKKYGEMYATMINITLVSAIKVLQKSDKQKVEVMVTDAKFLIERTKAFYKDHHVLIIETLEALKTELNTHDKEFKARSQEIGKVLSTTFKF